MTGGLRRRLARREVRAALAARRPGPLPADPRQRRVLLVLPPADEAGDAGGSPVGGGARRAAWALIDALDLPDRQLVPVVVGERLGPLPDRFAGAVRLVGPDDHDWRRLPSRPARRAVWSAAPDVAVHLAGSDLGPALIVGASPAAVRVGVHAPEREAFYDLMVQPEPDPAQTVAALGRLLRALRPAVLPFRPC